MYRKVRNALRHKDAKKVVGSLAKKTDPAPAISFDTISGPSSNPGVGTLEVVRLEEGFTETIKELQDAILQFQESCAAVSAEVRKEHSVKVTDISVSDQDLESALKDIGGSGDVRQAGQIFGNRVTDVLKLREHQKHAAEGTWTYKVGNFLAALFPLAMLSLNLTSAISGVFSNFNSNVNWI